MGLDQPLAGGYCRRIPIERHDVGTRVEQGGTITTRPECTIENELAWTWIQRVNNLPEEDGNVTNRSAFWLGYLLAWIRHHSAPPSYAGRKLARPCLAAACAS